MPDAPSQLHEIASLLRAVPEEWAKVDWRNQLWAEDRAGRYLMDAVQLGAFRKDRHRKLWHEIDAGSTAPNSVEGETNYMGAFYAIVELLQEQGIILPNAGGDDLLRLGCRAIADLIDAEADLRNAKPQSKSRRDAIIDILRKLPPGRGLEGKEIADKLPKRHRKSESTLRRHDFPEMIRAGLIVNTPGIGYHLPTSH